jgi:hypothetical protein
MIASDQVLKCWSPKGGVTGTPQSCEDHRPQGSEPPPGIPQLGSYQQGCGVFASDCVSERVGYDGKLAVSAASGYIGLAYVSAVIGNVRRCIRTARNSIIVLPRRSATRGSATEVRGYTGRPFCLAFFLNKVIYRRLV